MSARSPDSPASPRTAVFASEGEFWAIGYVDFRFLMRDLKGLGYLQHLLRYPNQEFHCLELLGGLATNDAEGRQEVSGSAVSRGDSISVDHPVDSGPIVDDQARAAYKREIIRLKEEQEDHLERGDQEAADRIQSEIHAIAHELGRAIGLGRRVRRMGSTSERARLNIGSAIRTALAKISEHDSRLGVILGRDIRTGTFCQCVPAPSDPIAWQFATSEQGAHPENHAPVRWWRAYQGRRQV